MKLLFLGDLLYDYHEIRKDIVEIGEYLKRNEYYTVLNLEAPFRSDTPIKKWINLYNSEEVIDVLKAINTLAVCIANNHIMDWGKKGLEHLLHKLDNNGIKYFGAGLNINDALRPAKLNFEDKKIGLMGFGWDEEMCIYAEGDRPGVAPLEPGYIIDSLAKLRESVDLVVVNLHWGYEYEVYPLPIHRKLAHEIIDSGADLIVGHHPHVVQLFELYNGKYIYYSLGNFYFGSRRENLLRLNEIAAKLSKNSLGVLYDVKNESIENFYCQYQNGVTRIVKSFRLEQLTGISLTEYDTIFRKIRTSSRKPSLYISSFANTNKAKLKFCLFKEGFVKIILMVAIKMSKFFGIYEWIRLRYKSNINSPRKGLK
jgi:hypothetical protein